MKYVDILVSLVNPDKGLRVKPEVAQTIVKFKKKLKMAHTTGPVL